ncbi:MAG: VOC family protein [Chloroflexi bacterium]|nr:VOC family protein [Chloroflexota bacterium]
MGKVRGLAEVVLWVHSLERSIEFYRDVLGLAVISPPERTNPIFLQAGPAQLGIPQLVVLVQLPADAPAFAPPRTLHHLALELAPEDFDSEHARLTGLGFELRTGQHPVLPSRTMYLDDPDGNEVELICTA